MAPGDRERGSATAADAQRRVQGGPPVIVRTLAEVLADHPFFGDLDRGMVEFIAGCGRNVAFHRGDVLFAEGASADRFFLVEHGRVSVEMHIPGRGGVVIDTVEERDVVGWSWLFPPYRWHFDARAVTDVRAVEFDGRCLRAKCDDDPRLGYMLMQRFAERLMRRLQATRIRLLDLYG